MGKTVGSILGVVAGIAEIAVGIATLNPGLIIAGIATEVASVGALLAQSQHTPPDTTTSAVKSPTPPRVSGYGRNRLHFAMEFDQ